VAALPALVIGYGTGRLPPSLNGGTSEYSRPDVLAELRSATTTVPAGAPLSADASLTVWFANRPLINDFPDKLADDMYVVIDRNGFLSGPTHPDQRLAAVAQLPLSGRRLLSDDGRFQVWSPVGG
jgi:hypothetical protein